MALLEEQFTEKLDAGAPDITYEGNEGKEQQIAQALWDKLPPQARMQFGSFAQFFSSGAWKKVLAVLQQQMQGGQEEIQETETETIGRAPQEGLGALMPQPRPMAFGGVAGADGRQAYGLGSIFKSVTKPIKKVLKSDIGKIGLTAAALGAPFGGGAWFGPGSGFGVGKAGLGSFFGKGSWNPLTALTDYGPGMSKFGNLIGKFPGGWKGAAGTAAALAPFAMSAAGKWDADETFDNLKLKAQEFGFDYEQMIRDIQNAENEEDYLAVLAQYNLSASDLPPWSSQKHAEGGRAMAQGGRIGYRHGTDINEAIRRHLKNPPLTEYEKEMKRMSPGDIAYEKELFRKFLEGKSTREKRDLLHSDEGYTWGHRALEYTDDPISEEFYETGEHFNRGGRVAAQEGGLMDLGGMEKDYRQEGGFVPIGGKEKADDVPARLSKNEFVFTADAVRAAGGGDIDQGAEIMENVMKNLERGGEISDESQGQGARDMFATSERLSEVV